VPSPERQQADYSTDPPQVTDPADGDVLARALRVLLDPALAAVVDLVAWVVGDDIHVANSAGEAILRCSAPNEGFTVVRGRDPVADQDPLHGTPLSAALADPSPPASRNAYPFAAERLLSAFADPDRSPDLHVVHTPRHHWPERGGHLGEHGSLDAAQSRAPLLLSGAGIRLSGISPTAARVVDVAPTLAALAGCTFPGIDGRVLTEFLDPERRPSAVVGMLWDGTNSNDLLDLARSWALPAVGRLLERGGALLGGAVAEFPSVTLVNHTSALTGVGPGRHGIVHNVFYDRVTGSQVLANDAATWHRAGELLRPGVRTVFEVVSDVVADVVSQTGGRTACVNEPTDRGADYSTFGLVRTAGDGNGARGLRRVLPAPELDPNATVARVAASDDYAWGTQVDAFGLVQMQQLFSGQNPQWPVPPRLTWWNTTLTDAAHHAGGPYSDIARASLTDADRRLGVFLDLLDSRGLFESTAFLLTADHGSEGADPACTGDWDEALRAAGIAFRDEGYGAIYLG
jgi:phosphonoacetate hydrolase